MNYIARAVTPIQPGEASGGRVSVSSCGAPREAIAVPHDGTSGGSGLGQLTPAPARCRDAHRDRRLGGRGRSPAPRSCRTGPAVAPRPSVVARRSPGNVGQASRRAEPRRTVPGSFVNRLEASGTCPRPPRCCTPRCSRTMRGSRPVSTSTFRDGLHRPGAARRSGAAGRRRPRRPGRQQRPRSQRERATARAARDALVSNRGPCIDPGAALGQRKESQRHRVQGRCRGGEPVARSASPERHCRTPSQLCGGLRGDWWFPVATGALFRHDRIGRSA